MGFSDCLMLVFECLQAHGFEDFDRKTPKEKCLISSCCGYYIICL